MSFLYMRTTSAPALLTKRSRSGIRAMISRHSTKKCPEPVSASGPIAAVKKLADESGMNEEADARALERYEKAKKINGPLFEVSEDEESMGTGDPDALEHLLNNQIEASELEDDADTGQGLDFFSDPHAEDLED